MSNLMTKANILLATRVVQLVFALVALGLSGYVTDWWMSFYEETGPSQTNIILFSSIWSVLAVVILIVVPWKLPSTGNTLRAFAFAGLECLTALFWFAGFIAAAVFIGDRACFGNVCNAARASIAFGAFETIAFGATAGMATMHAIRLRKNPSAVSDKPAPPMGEA